MDKTEKLTVDVVGTYNGHSVKRNGIVSVDFKTSYDERIKIIKSIAFIGQNVKIGVRVGSDKPMSLGMYSLNGLRIDRDGEATLKFTSESDYVEHDNLSKLSNLDSELIKIKMSADIILEDDE